MGKCRFYEKTEILNGLFFPVMPYVDDIFVFFKVFDEKIHELDIVFVFKSNVSRGNLFDLGGDERIALCSKLVEYLSNREETVSEIIETFPHYVVSPEIKAHCADTVKYGIVDDITKKMKAAYPGKVCDINGARVQFEHGWGLVRASSNMPELVLIFEADTMEHLLEIRSIFKTYTREYEEISDNWKNDVAEA